MGIKVGMISNYLGGFARDAGAQEIYLEEKVRGWEVAVRTLLGGGGGAPAPAGGIHRPAKISPTGVGFCEAYM